MSRNMVRVDTGRLKEARKESKLTQEELAEQAGVSTKKIQDIEATGRINKDTLIIIAGLFDKPVEFLMARGQEPWQLPRRQWDPLLMPPGALLRPDLGIVPFHGREKELRDLLKWCGVLPEGEAVAASVKPVWLGLRLYFGSGGMGKTRLAIQLCTTIAEMGWRAGFLDYDSFVQNESEWDMILRDKSPILLVLDYAENHRAELSWLLTKCLQTRPAHIRFLILARTAGEWLDHLKTDRCVGDLLQGGATTVHRLGPLSSTPRERLDSYRRAGEAFAAVLKIAAPLGRLADISQPYFERALLLHMMALANIMDEKTEDETGILNYILLRERRFWDALLKERGLPHTLLEGVGQAMALITLNQGIEKKEEGLEVLRIVPLLEGQPLHVLHALNSLLGDCYPGAQWIEPVQPDLLGEHLVDTCLEQCALRTSLLKKLRELSGKRK